MLKDIYPRMHSYEPRRSSGASSRLSHIFKCHCVPKKKKKKRGTLYDSPRTIFDLFAQTGVIVTVNSETACAVPAGNGPVYPSVPQHTLQFLFSVFFLFIFLSASLLPTHTTAWMYAHDSPWNNGAPCFREQPVSGVITACVLALCWPPPSTPKCPCMAFFWAF